MIISNVLTSPMNFNIDDKHMLLIIKQTITESFCALAASKRPNKPEDNEQDYRVVDSMW